MSKRGPVTRYSSQSSNKRNKITNNNMALDDMPLFLEVAQEADIEGLATLFDGGPYDVNCSDMLDTTALMLAAYEGKADAVQFLIKLKADIDAKSIWGETALMFAARRNHIDVIRVLLNNQANPNLRNLQNQTADMIAASYGHKDAAKIILTYRESTHQFISPAPSQPLGKNQEIVMFSNKGDAIHAIRHTNGSASKKLVTSSTEKLNGGRGLLRKGV